MSRKRRSRKKNRRQDRQRERQKHQAAADTASNLAADPEPIVAELEPEPVAVVEPQPQAEAPAPVRLKPEPMAAEPPPDDAAETSASAPRPARRLPHWLRLAVTVLVHISAVAAVVVYAGYYGPLRVTGFDAICRPLDQVVIRAKVEHDGPLFLNPDVIGLEVEFILTPISRELPPPRLDGPRATPFLPEGEVVDRATTDSDGFATLEVKAPELEGNYVYGLRVPDASLQDLEYSRSYALVAVTAENRPILVSDIDNTICTTNITDLLADRPRAVAPLDRAPQILSKFAEKAQIVYLTARPYAFTERTRNWLSAHRFPPGPIFFRDLSELLPEQPSESGFKKAFLAEKIKPRFSRLLWGFGNIEGDLEAYRPNGMSTILIRPKNPKIVEGIDSAHAVDSWAEIPALVEPTL